MDVEWRVAMRPGRRRHLEPGSYEALAEKRKASVRAKVEHPFLYVKWRFGYAKVRYRGLAKNAHWLALLLGLANLIDGRAPSGGMRGAQCANHVREPRWLRKAASRPQQTRSERLNHHLERHKDA